MMLAVALAAVSIAPSISATPRVHTLLSRRSALLGGVALVGAADSLALLRPQRVAAATAPPDDFGMIPEPNKLEPSTNYLENAAKLARHLEWAATDGVDLTAGELLSNEIKDFAALYRKDKYTPYGLMPGFTGLVTAYDALSAHNARYGPGKVAVPEQLAGTMLRNVADARKQFERAQRKAAEAAAEAAAGATM